MDDKVPVPSPVADLEIQWTYLEPGLDQIMMGFDGRLTSAQYASMYTVTYNCCRTSGLTPAGGGLGLGGSGRTGANLLGAGLYYHLVEYLRAHVRSIRNKSNSLRDEALLRFYAQEWHQYTFGAKCVDRVFAELNKHWVKREIDEGQRRVYRVYTLMIVQWKKGLFIHLHNKNRKLARPILRLIERERNGEMIDAGLLRAVITSFTSFLQERETSAEFTLAAYKEYFQKPFLEATESYYKQESDSFLAENDLVKYLEKAERRLKEEEDRVDRYMHSVTRERLIRKCEIVLIRNHKEAMWKRFQSLLDLDQYDDLRRMYLLLSRIQNGLRPLQNTFEEHVLKDGLAAVKALVGDGGAGAEVGTQAYFDVLLRVRLKHKETVHQSFDDQAGFVESLDRACKAFVNNNAVTGTSGSSIKSAELLAQHADALLRANSKSGSDAEREDDLNNVVIVFGYIKDKDAFQTFYATKLSKRIIHGASVARDEEINMIAKLRDACDLSYADHLRGMFSDMATSEDLTNDFKEKMAHTHEDSDAINFSIKVFGTNFWPMRTPTDKFAIPVDILPTYERFTRYYAQKRRGHKLTWLWNYSTNELHTGYLKEKYILICSSYQMAVLVQYNDADILSLEELLAATGISQYILVQVLGVLVKARIIINEEEDQYGLNPNFKSKKIRVNINVPIKAEIKAESEGVSKTIDDHRKYAIQATIVRVMKVRRVMKHQALIHEVVTQLSQRFAPEVSEIKKAIENLLEKEHIERGEGDRDIFKYVA